jgi:polyvinyl alcohol dehydrogenase (cytochrome)
MTPEKIYEKLTTGSMKEKAKESPTRRNAASRNSFPDGRWVAPLPATRKTCPTSARQNPAMTDPATSAGWNGWGNNGQQHAISDRPQQRVSLRPMFRKLKLNGPLDFQLARRQVRNPRSFPGSVFVGSDNGYYLLRWTPRPVAFTGPLKAVRLFACSLTVGAVSGQGNARYAVFYGDGHANILRGERPGRPAVVEDESGLSHRRAHHRGDALLQRQAVSFLSSSSEEFSSGNAGLSLLHVARQPRGARCQYRKDHLGNVGGAGEMKPYKIQSNGRWLYRTGGGGVWNSPTIDPVRQMVYISTGDATTFPHRITTDGVIAIDMNMRKAGMGVSGR